MISLCCIDVAHAVMSLSHLRHCPHVSHIACLEHLCGYIRKFSHGALKFCTGIPNHETHFGEHPMKYDWRETAYSNPTEEIPHDAITPKG